MDMEEVAILCPNQETKSPKTNSPLGPMEDQDFIETITDARFP